MMSLLGYSSSTVYKPFQEEINTGHSSFTLSLPRHYASYSSQAANGNIKKRDFYFSEFNIVPSFYNQRAAQLGLDFEAQQAEMIKLDLRFSFIYNKDMLYKNAESGAEIKWDQNSKGLRIDRLTDSINNFFDMQKPESLLQSPVFIDWYDSEWLAPDPNKYVPQYLPFYYEEEDVEAPFDYIDALPKSVRLIPGANNYKFPTEAFESQSDSLSRIRMRINIAPNTKLLLSTDKLLLQLGFSPEQFGKRGELKKIVLENTSSSGYLDLVAANPPEVNIVPTTTTIILKGNSDRSESTSRHIETTMAVYMHSEELAARLKTEFESLSQETNVIMNIQYVTNESKFKIIFPSNSNIVANVHCDIELAERLGFGPITRITNNMTSIAMEEKSLEVDAENKSRALAFNTGMLLATLDGATNMQSDGLEEPLLATILPTESGTFALKLNSMLKTFQLSTPSLMGNGHFPVKINLWSLTKGSKKVPLNWKIDVIVSGVLEGI